MLTNTVLRRNIRALIAPGTAVASSFLSPFGRTPASASAPGRAPAAPAPARRGPPSPFGLGAVRPAARVPVAAPASVPTPPETGETAEAEDLFALDGGFVRFRGAPRPARVSPEVWEAVFPPDRSRVATLAGRRFLAGEEPDAAVREAALEIEREQWRSGPDADRLVALAPFFPGAEGPPPVGALAAAVAAVPSTARASWRRLSAPGTTEKTVFLLRSWRAPAGRCLLCWGPAAPADRRWPREGDPEGDAIHEACKPAMKDVGPVFVRLVLEEAARIAADPPPCPEPPPPDAGLDPDDPSTWGLPDGVS